MTMPQDLLIFCQNEIKKITPDYHWGTQRENIEKRFKCSFLLSHIVLWSFKGIFVRANTN